MAGIMIIDTIFAPVLTHRDDFDGLPKQRMEGVGDLTGSWLIRQIGSSSRLTQMLIANRL